MMHEREGRLAGWCPRVGERGWDLVRKWGSRPLLRTWIVQEKEGFRDKRPRSSVGVVLGAGCGMEILF